jgi:D-inositol-3-phosphate glycosyltransferase
MSLEEFEFCLSVIGGDPEITQEEMALKCMDCKLCEKYGLEDLVALLGKRSQDTLAYYYSAAKVVVMPSHYESFGMVALEAMACGTPVVHRMWRSGLPGQDGITGFTVPAGDHSHPGRPID